MPIQHLYGDASAGADRSELPHRGRAGESHEALVAVGNRRRKASVMGLSRRLNSPTTPRGNANSRFARSWFIICTRISTRPLQVRHIVRGALESG